MEEVVESCVRAYRGTEHSELELRLGSFQNNEFRPGISKELFEDLERDFRESSLQEMPWEEVVDYYYSIKNGDPIRSRVICDAQNISMHTEHVSKKTTQSVVLSISTDGTEVVRVCHCVETPVTPPTTCIPTHVRIKQRKRFSDIRNGMVVWVYELSKTWSACSRTAVEHIQHVSSPVYEVECELVDEGNTYKNEVDDKNISESIITKSKMFLGEEGICTVEMLHSFKCKERTKKKVY
jgi:hypothetical protein